jgi:hypothetical protein
MAKSGQVIILGGDGPLGLLDAGAEIVYECGVRHEDILAM